jgi:hypothetical protein
MGSLTNTVIFEVQETGNDGNGGGFDPTLGGLDYTQGLNQKTIIFDGKNITGTTNGISATITISGYSVSENDLGNTLNITDGINYIPNHYTIISINNNTWTLNSNVSINNASGLIGIVGGALKTLEKAIKITKQNNIQLEAFIKSRSIKSITGYLTHREHRLGLPPTAAQIATAIWQDTLTGGDFGTAGSIGLLLATNINATISSRLAASAVPTNFSTLNIDTSGRVILQPNGLNNITAWGGVTARQAIFYAAAATVGTISNLPVGPAVIKGLDFATTTVVIAFDANSNRIGVELTPP